MEQTQLTSKIDFYVEAFERVREKTGDDKVAAIIVEQLGKDERTAVMRGDQSRSAGKQVSNGDAPATEKQIDFLRTLGVEDIPDGLTRRRASEMIDEARE